MLGDNAQNLPDVFDITNDLMDLYDVFGAAAVTEQQQPAQTPPENNSDLGMSMWEIEGVSRHFQGLL